MISSIAISTPQLI